MSAASNGANSNATGLPAVLRRRRLVWRVNGVVLAILVCVLGVWAYVSNREYERAALSSARDLTRVSSEMLLHSIKEHMMQGEPSHIGHLIERLATGSSAFRSIRLYAHDGRALTSRRDSAVAIVTPDTWPCTVCHRGAEVMRDSTRRSIDAIIDLPNDGRIVSVVTPVYREPGCSTATCHAQSSAAPVLGLLQTDFSLEPVDTLVAQHNVRTALVLLGLLVLGAVATWWMTDRLVGSRIRALSAGAQRLAKRDLSFRFSDGTGDAIAQLASVMDEMTSEFSSTLAELTSTKEYLQGIVESSADIIITVGPRGHIRSFNSGAEKILGFTRDEVIGQRMETLFANPRERDAAIQQLRHTDHVVNYLTRFRTKAGDTRNVILTLSRLRSPNGIPIGTFGISKDITEELRLQRELMQAERMAALGQAITGIQHSIKNLLNVLKGGSYMVKLGLAKDDRQMLTEGWTMVQEGIDHMTDMSKSMLDFARERRLNIKPVDLSQLLRKVHGMAEGKFREEGIALALEANHALPPVECDAEMIHSVVMDLLSNALDACSWKQYGKGETPRVSVRLTPAALEGYVDIEVKDNGEGMTEEVKARAFTPFFSTKKKAGTGMGLAVVARIVSSHGGKTTVESEPGKGAAFHVLLPIKVPGLREEEDDG